MDKLKPDFGCTTRVPAIEADAILQSGYYMFPAHLMILSVIDQSGSEFVLCSSLLGMNKVLQKYIPGQVARYSDDHEPRGFGDNVQKWGTNIGTH